MADTQDVDPASSPGISDATPASSPGPVVLADSTPAPDRTAEQMFRELQRKSDRQDRQLAQVVQAVAGLAQQRQAAPAPAPTAARTDDELWTAAQQGDRTAFVEHQQRITDRRIAQVTQAQSHVNVVDGQMQALVAKYPVLRDASHPLTQTVNQAYGLYVRHGYAPTKATLLDAAKTAIADRPDLVAALHQAAAPSREAGRLAALQQARTGQTGAMGRQSPAAQAAGRALTLSAEEVKLAQRMNLTPAKALEAKENFVKRNQDGTSRLGTIGAFVDPENF